MTDLDLDKLREKLTGAITPIVPNTDGVIWVFEREPVTVARLVDTLVDGPLSELIGELAKWTHACLEASADLDAAQGRARIAEHKIEKVRAIHKPIRVYDECECDSESDHDQIEVMDYVACAKSFIGWACEVCCYDDEYPLEYCPHGAIHEGIRQDGACPTVAAMRADPKQLLNDSIM